MKIKWYSIAFDEFAEDEETLRYFGYKQHHLRYAEYTDPIDKANKLWNSVQYNRIQAEGNWEFENYWKASWNKRMAMQKLGFNITFPTIPTRQHGEFLETFEPKFQRWFVDNTPQEDYQMAIKDKKDILMLNTKYDEWRKHK